MITEKDLLEAIAECQGERNPNANTCIKLAAFYTIREHLFPKQTQEENECYSYASEPAEIVIEGWSGTEFSQAVDGQELYGVLEVIDDLMSTLQVLNPRLYDSVLRKF